MLAAFESAGVDALLLKGPGLSALLYTAGERRSYSDTDLLVEPSQLDAAEKALAALGYRLPPEHQFAEVGQSKELSLSEVDDVHRVVHGHTWMRSTSLDRSIIDLHHRLAGAGASPGAVWSALAARRTSIEVGGRRAAVLDRAGQAMHLAMHAAQHGSVHERQLGELALALERWPADVWDAAAALAREIRATRAFAAGLRLLPRGVAEASRLELPLTGELDWKVRHRATRPRGTFHLEALLQADGLRERLRILRSALLPNRAWIAREHSSAQGGRLRLSAAYARHLLRAPVWAARAWRFRRLARRAGRRR